MAIALFYSFLSGFWGVVVTDLIQFGVAIVGSVVFAVVAANSVGGMDGLLGSAAVNSGETLSFFPSLDADPEVWYQFLVFVLIMWWSWQGADGGGYIIQRMMSAKNERHALLGTFWFAVANYILRVWPWIVVALASMVLLPELTSHRSAYPQTMVETLPAGLRGLFVAVFLAAFMSTIDTHLNWGSSYIVNDIYKRFIRKHSSEQHYVMVSKLTSLVLMVVAGVVALFLRSISAAWEFVWAMGAGIGAVLILRWFWWRINAWSEISALATSLLLAIILQLRDFVTGDELALYIKALIIVGTSMVVWITVTILTQPEPEEVLRNFCNRVRPGGWWPYPVEDSGIGKKTLIAWVGGIGLIYGGMFFLGSIVLQKHDDLAWSGGITVLGIVLVWVGLRGLPKDR
jgi:Na+/proline symporter